MLFTYILNTKDIRETLDDFDLFDIDKDIRKFLKCTQNSTELLVRDITTSITSNNYDVLSRNKSIQIIKIRVKDLCNKKGKSSGYRVIMLVDFENRIAFFLHIYSKNTKSNITTVEKRSLTELVKRCTHEE